MGQVHLYDYSDQSGARAVNEQGLKALTLTGFSSADASHTYHHSKTLNTDGQAYPYPTGLTGHGSPVHYGDWVTPADLGTLGMVYWEHEEGGSNPGYHFSYIGFENGVRKDGSSLCTAHDDGGKITAYGYGYYWSKGETEPLLETQRIALDGRSTEAAAELEKQIPPFSFVTYQTSDTGLRLLSGTTGNGYWFLSQGDVWFTYTVSPFFADSYAVTAVSTGITGGTTGVEPGTDALPYQGRSVEQLQYINWSYYDDQGSSTRDVTGSGSMYKYYPYLQYSRVTWGYQSKEDAIAGDSTGGTRPIRTWKQSHDLNGQSLADPTDASLNYSFHPIAGSVYDSGSSTDYRMVLYNWFGSKYDGQSYYIKNVNIDSYCYNVGLFGTTAGAEIANIVLYSDNGAVIQRNTDPTPSSGTRTVRQYSTSYALGGLVGIAYDYNSSMGTGSITTSAISGGCLQRQPQQVFRRGGSADQLHPRRYQRLHERRPLRQLCACRRSGRRCALCGNGLLHRRYHHRWGGDPEGACPRGQQQQCLCRRQLCRPGQDEFRRRLRPRYLCLYRRYGRQRLLRQLHQLCQSRRQFGWSAHFQ